MLFLYDIRLWIKIISRFWQRTNYLPSQVMMVLVTSTVTLTPIVSSVHTCTLPGPRVILLSIQHKHLLSGLDHQVRTGGEGVNILEPLVCGLS